MIPGHVLLTSTHNDIHVLCGPLSSHCMLAVGKVLMSFPHWELPFFPVSLVI